MGFASLRFTEIGQPLPVRADSRLQISTTLIVSRDSRITEIQPPQACGTSEIPETTSGMEIISGAQTISGTETIVFVMTGKNTFSRGSRGIGTAIGTVTATTGGMVTNARSLTDRG